MRLSEFFLGAGALSAGIAVAAGAFGAHALRARLTPSDLAIFETGARYQMYHGLALVAVAWVAERTDRAAIRVAGWSFLVGTILFSGSLYGLALFGLSALGAVTPFGGVAFLVGWTGLALSARKSPAP